MVDAILTKMKGPEAGREMLASIVVFLVALPLCMGIAIASGAPPALGLFSGIIGGIVVGSLAGSPLQVSGPAAGLAVLVWEIIAEYGLPALGVACLLGGALQIVAAKLQLGRWFRATAPAVIRGMLSGIGVLILGSQFHVMVDDAPRSGGLANLISIPEAIVKGVTTHPETVHHLAAIIGVITLATLIGWSFFRPKVLKAVPPALVAVIVASVAAAALGFPISKVEVPSSLVASLNIPPIEAFKLLGNPAFLGAAFGLAVIASAETLLCATAVDQLHDGPKTKYDKELMAQGVGNMVAGVIGALPITGVIVRSSANVEAGAKTRASAIIHGFWLLGLVGLAPFVLEHIPTSALAAILVYIGWKLFSPQQIKKLYDAAPGEALVYGVTLAGIVSFDLLTGVIAGVVVAAARLLVRLSKLNIDTETSDDGSHVDVCLRGAATFLNLPLLAEALERLPKEANIKVHLENLDHVDHAIFELLTEFGRQHENGGGTVEIEWHTLQGLYREKPGSGDAV
jgi:MFS superfamily sulfate permease-like transporter